MLGQREDAEDAAQETLLRALRSLASYDPNRAFEPWLMTIAANRCRTAISNRVRRRQYSELPEAIPDPTPNEMDARQLEEEVDLALERLRSDHRSAFVLFHERQLSYAEIAEILDRPVGTIKTWVHRARRELIAFLRAREVVQESYCELP